ncbi:L-histidine N(alpha)-methyltransferase [Mucilaginibacter terrigena]|uniref:L-histidine N(Alpha)-methyltransferase n=1 Tax=Mucilaginibacter terrigena TaxID=2492395 RepID=A0A4Q5LJT7_9SPHI|nr:L-histidine N(alpha)-methyltransferase [Mucilaginibacter terrigena]
MISMLADNKTTYPKQFYADALAGLTTYPKQLPVKYFYDAEGDRLFQQIMNCPEYYVTDCELEIFTQQTGVMADHIIRGGEPFDLIELGAGDCTKSRHLLSLLLATDTNFIYKPIDISTSTIQFLETTLPIDLPGLRLIGMNGDYFDMLAQTAGNGTRKVVLCLGANIGNMPVAEAQDFCIKLRSYLSPGDMVIIGFDLKKDPHLIRAAYDDEQGITARFNLNLLSRMNRDLGADFDLGQFKHYCIYDPASGACKSYLISLEKQRVKIGDEIIAFQKNEYIWMEISQKYDLAEVDELAVSSGFTPVKHLLDSKEWFTDAIWTVKQ